MYKIDKNVPLPSPAGGPAKYPFKDMAVGDSFFVETDRNKLNGCFARHKPKKFACRTVTEKGKKGVRVWRTE